jgi:hypothetical protein
VNARGLRGAWVGLALAIAAGPVHAAAVCPQLGVVGGTATAGSHLSRSATKDLGLGASLAGRVAGPVLLGVGYDASLLDQVPEVSHSGTVRVAIAGEYAGLRLCPTVGAEYERVRTSSAEAEGRVESDRLPIGLAVGRRFPVSTDLMVTAFVEPLLVRTRVRWESTDGEGWRISDAERSWERAVWLGVRMDMGGRYLLARYRPAHSAEPQEVGVGFGMAIGRR